MISQFRLYFPLLCLVHLTFSFNLFYSIVCNFKECCRDVEIPADFERLKRNLTEKVYGQHLVQEAVINALKGHWKEEEPPKALTLSFHGNPGCGKNYVTSFIEDSIYIRGSKSSHVHHFLGRIHFPLEEKTHEYQKNLYEWIKTNVTKCPRQLFIFDEVDKMPPKVLDILKPMIDYNRHVEQVDYRKAVFIFLSNTGSSLITEQAINLWKSGIKREDIKITDFEKLITQGSFNEAGGFQHSDNIKSNLIDHYIPFLPLEYEHVVMCIKSEFQKRKVNDPSQQHIDEVLENIEFGPPPHNLYSKTGCKRLSQKVAYVIQKYGLYKEPHKEL